jgi:hypothetical protein
LETAAKSLILGHRRSSFRSDIRGKIQKGFGPEEPLCDFIDASNCKKFQPARSIRERETYNKDKP